MSYTWRGITWQVMRDDKSAFWLYGQVVTGWNYYRVAITEAGDAAIEQIVKRYLKLFLPQIASVELELLKYPIEILAIEDDTAYSAAAEAYAKNL